MPNWQEYRWVNSNSTVVLQADVSDKQKAVLDRLTEWIQASAKIWVIYVNWYYSKQILYINMYFISNHTFSHTIVCRVLETGALYWQRGSMEQIKWDAYHLCRDLTLLWWSQGTECDPKHMHKERVLAGNWNVCTEGAEVLICFPWFIACLFGTIYILKKTCTH